jgi:hypothetical protein
MPNRDLMQLNLDLMQRLILRREVMKFLKTYWPTIVPIAGAAVQFALPSLVAYAAAHPHTAFGVLCGCIIAAHNMTAPKDQNIVNR